MRTTEHSIKERSGRPRHHLLEDLSTWIDTLAPEIDILDEEVICGHEQDSVEQVRYIEDVDSLVLPLAEGLPDDAEYVVWCCVDVRNV
jgi:hypothetical protein